MSGPLAGGGPHTSEWQVRLLVTEDGDLTRAHAVLEPGTALGGTPSRPTPRRAAAPTTRSNR